MTDPIPATRRGSLKIYLGYAAGVGKTYAMLVEARSLAHQGVDVVVGYFEPHGRKDTILLMEGLEEIPRKEIQYRGATFYDMDTEAILRRRPAVCAVDEFAHTNVPSSSRTKRWEDVQVLMDAGICVLTTMNVQHLESLNDHVWQVTGVRVRETIPDWVVKQADEVVMVDLPPQALLNRLRRGVVYPQEKAQKALQNFFKESSLVVLRELALRQTAYEVDVRTSVQDDVASGLPAAETGSVAGAAPAAPASDRLLIYVSADPSTAMLIRRGRRVADYLHADCFAVAVQPDPTLQRMPPAQRETLDRHLNFARTLHIETRVLQGENAAEALVDFARRNQVTQIILARAQQGPRVPILGQSLIQQVVRLARDMQVTIVAERRREE
jgi:two-component system, OmpR family, sensor histidine kinase KdpD